MNLVNQDAAASHDQWDFRSGIAFGVAAGTGVAFVQEEKNPLLNLIRKASMSFWVKVRRLRIRRKKHSLCQKVTGLAGPPSCRS
jgi:hypothetical protein